MALPALCSTNYALFMSMRDPNNWRMPRRVPSGSERVYSVNMVGKLGTRGAIQLKFWAWPSFVPRTRPGRGPSALQQERGHPRSHTAWAGPDSIGTILWPSFKPSGSLDMSQNSKNDLGKVLGLILGREKCQLNCTPDLLIDL